jgi:hypothetical protein
MAEVAPFALPETYNTQLSPLDELAFRQWVSSNNVPFNSDATGPTDYDMRGYWQGLQNGNPQARSTEINQNDNRPHYTDYYKTPLHQTFSSGSRWAGPDAPQWLNDSQLFATNGRLLFDEKSPSRTQLLQLPIPR